MNDLNDLDNDTMFKQIAAIFNSEAVKEHFNIEEDPHFLFEEDYLNELFKERIIKDLYNIKKIASAKNLQAFCSAVLKNYKRDLITLHINKIKEKEGLKLTTRSADIFFIKYLNRSVGEKYLCSHFSNDFKKDIILTPDYKKQLFILADRYWGQVAHNLNYVVSLYRSLKKSIIYAD